MKKATDQMNDFELWGPFTGSNAIHAPRNPKRSRFLSIYLVVGVLVVSACGMWGWAVTHG